MRWLALSLSALAFVGTAVAGKADSPVETVEAPTIAKMLEELGHAPEIQTDSQGDPMLTAAWEGSRYVVLFYGCNVGRCNAIQFRAWYDLTEKVPLEPINQWNRTSLLGRAFVDADGDPTIEHTVRLKGGVTLQHLREERDWFFKAVSEFEALVEQIRAKPAQTP